MTEISERVALAIYQRRQMGPWTDEDLAHTALEAAALARAEANAREPVAWRCFHCDEVFTSQYAAKAHFGPDEGAIPACQVKASEGGLVEALRRAEKDAADAWFAIHNETTDAAKAYYAQASRHAEQLRLVEEQGYERGLADAKAHPETLGLCHPAPQPSGPVEVKPLQWNECRALYGGRKLVATDCFGREYARLDLKGQPDDFINDFKARVQEAYNTAILSALEATPAPMVTDALELSGNTGELIDKMAEAIRGDTVSDDTPWATLSEDRKIGWRGDAERALAVVKKYLTARRPTEQAVPSGLVEFAKEMCRVGFDGGSIDDCDILDTAVKHGLCRIAQYRSDMTGIANAEYLEEGDAVYVFDGPLAAPAAPTAGGGDA